MKGLNLWETQGQMSDLWATVNAFVEDAHEGRSALWDVLMFMDFTQTESPSGRVLHHFIKQPLHSSEQLGFPEIKTQCAS